MDPDIAALYARHRETHLVAISDYQRRTLIGREDAPVIHHGIDLAAFDFNARGGDYLAFLGRMIPEKGPHEAIAVARAAGLPLVLAGPAEDESGWFGAVVAPQVDDVQVRYVGPVGAKDRNTILAGAAALVYPVCDPEPFGLVMVEAMACGTPVVATNVGAVPEIVRDGVTGFVADPAGLADRIGAAAALDRATVRRWAVARFDHHRMADDYEALYRALAAGRR
jgi:glycosyltransferase involved in cell wall biosynthesis